MSGSDGNDNETGVQTNYMAIVEGPAAKLAELRTCSSCPFSFTAGARTDCRKLPPVGHLVPGDKKRRADFISFFPPTRPGDWCGEHPLRRGSK